MHTDDLRLLIICYVIGIATFLFVFFRHKKIRKVEDTPRSKIGSAPQGFVEVQGFAWPQGNVFTTPDEFETVYYYFRLERQETRGSGKNKKKVWVTVQSFLHAPPFYVLDPTGLALVYLHNSDMNISSARTRNWSSLDDKRKKFVLEKLVTKSIPGFPPSNFLFGLFGSPYRIIENEIRVGSPIYASGDFRSEAAQTTQAKEIGLTLFYQNVIDADRKAIKNIDHLLDKNGDKKISEAEHVSGYANAGKWARNKAQTQNPEEVEFPVFGTLKSSEDHKLLIADVHESHLVARLKRFQYVAMFVGAFFMAAGTWILINSNSTSTNIELAAQTLPRKIVEQRIPSSTKPNVTEQHNLCVVGTVDACLELLKNQTQYKLDASHMDYYGKRACQLGAAEYCSNK